MPGLANGGWASIALWSAVEQKVLWHEWAMGSAQKLLLPKGLLRNAQLWPRWLVDTASEERTNSSTPAVVTGTAPALAKAGVGGF